MSSKRHDLPFYSQITCSSHPPDATPDTERCCANSEQPVALTCLGTFKNTAENALFELAEYLISKSGFNYKHEKSLSRRI